MIEADARKKWCPFARVPDGGGVTGAVTATNRHAGQKIAGDGKPRILRSNAMCIASECMAWRPLFEDRGIHGSRVKTGGYCGLAGPMPRA